MPTLNERFQKILRRLIPASKYDLLKRYAALAQQIKWNEEQLKSINERLKSTDEQFKSTNEQFKSTNEQIKSANERINSTNEQIKSTNKRFDSVDLRLDIIAIELRASIASSRGVTPQHQDDILKVIRLLEPKRVVG